MKPGWYFRSIFCLLSLYLIFSGQVSAEPVVTVTGLVKHHQRPALADLTNYRSVTVRTTEVGSGGAFHGVYRYQGVLLIRPGDCPGTSDYFYVYGTASNPITGLPQNKSQHPLIYFLFKRTYPV